MFVSNRYETHGGEDVPVYAIGPGSYLFSGTIEQSYIPHAIAYASCVSLDSSHCEKPPSDDACASPPLPVQPKQPLYTLQHPPPQPNHPPPPPPDPAPVEERKRSRDHPWNSWRNSSSKCGTIKVVVHILLLSFISVVIMT